MMGYSEEDLWRFLEGAVLRKDVGDVSFYLSHLLKYYEE